MVLSFYAGDWTPDGPDNVRVTIDGIGYDYESACNLIEIFDDPLPEDLLQLLLMNMHCGDEGPRAALDAEEERRIVQA